MEENKESKLTTEGAVQVDLGEYRELLRVYYTTDLLIKQTENEARDSRIERYAAEEELEKYKNLYELAQKRIEELEQEVKS